MTRNEQILLDALELSLRELAFSKTEKLLLEVLRCSASEDGLRFLAEKLGLDPQPDHSSTQMAIFNYLSALCGRCPDSVAEEDPEEYRERERPGKDRKKGPGAFKFPFGKYKGRDLHWIFVKDPAYLAWVEKQDWVRPPLSVKLEDFSQLAGVRKALDAAERKEKDD